MADRFGNPVNLPIIDTAMPAGPGFVRIYGKGGDAYAMFPDGTEKLLSGAGGVIIIDAGGRDVSYNESFDVTDLLAGTLGPVQTQDSLDVNDMFVGRSTVLFDTIEASDKFGEIEGLMLDDSLAFNDALAGTLGPVRAPDTFVATDNPEFGPLVLQDSFNVVEQADLNLDSVAVDSFVISARLGQITRFDDEQFLVGDAYGAQDTSVVDSFNHSDAFGVATTVLFDSLAVSDLLETTLSARNEESAAFGDLMLVERLTVADSLSIADARRQATVTNARLWPNTVVSNTGFTNPTNLTDVNETTAAVISATQSGGLVGGSSATVNGNIVVSCPDFNFTPEPGLNTVQLQVGYTTTASGGLQSGNSVNVAVEYSLNDGTTWTSIATVTTVAATANPTVNITATQAQLNQLRFRAVGSVVSGTTVLTGGANQQFQFRYARVQFNAAQTL